MSQDDMVVIRVTRTQRERIKQFGSMGDTMSIAVENLLNIAEELASETDDEIASSESCTSGIKMIPLSSLKNVHKTINPFKPILRRAK